MMDVKVSKDDHEHISRWVDETELKTVHKDEEGEL